MIDLDQVNAQLKPAFTALKQEMQHLQANPQVEENLLKAFQQQYPKPSWWRKCLSEPWQWSGVLVMSLLVCLLALNKPIVFETSPGFAADADTLYEDIPFIAIETGETILQQDSMRIVRAEVPHTVLASLGVPVNPQVASDTTRAEMLVGENDEYLAVRFIPSE